MRISVFGGTGTVGTPLVAQCLAAGHTVTLLARSPGTVPTSDAVTVIGGNALDPDAVAKTVVGADAVLSTLGGFGDSDATLHGTANIIQAMRETGPSRLVIMQGFHIEFPGDPGGWRRALVKRYLAANDRDLPANTAAMGEQLRAVEDLDWTLVRACRVVKRGPTDRVRTGTLRLAPWSKVTAGDVAATMLSVLHDPTTIRTAPMVQTT